MSSYNQTSPQPPRQAPYALHWHGFQLFFPALPRSRNSPFRTPASSTTTFASLQPSFSHPAFFNVVRPPRPESQRRLKTAAALTNSR
ncbi:hypothetical protein M413DRAFT_449967 [Hebeloma cylindrosporum]|uniref:Uncharacterized protein n=1 Tax=Hebeloma cylindrosporum TaxID=76867 RepID=A0A0C2Y1L1_HEBCY|nr:hypothetical protein M413DRAFT_449967 [Hebeloma cylindrosporum h7]